MENVYSRFSNLYTPPLSTNFVIRKFNELETIEYNLNSEEDAILQNLYIPCGVMDGSKDNQVHIIKFFPNGIFTSVGKYSNSDVELTVEKVVLGK